MFTANSRNRIVIIGAGGHAQVVADCLWRMADSQPTIQVVGYLDDNPSNYGKMILGRPVLGALARLPEVEHEAILIAIGSNSVRRQLYETFKAQGEQFTIAQHPKAIIAAEVQIGPGSMIMAGVVVNTGSRIGANVILNTGCTVDHHNQIGDHVHIAPGVHLGGNVVVAEGALVGIGATVMPGRSIGAGSIVGAGTLVHRDVPAGATVIGVPARLINQR